MSIRDEIASFQVRTTRCHTCLWLRQRPNEESEEWREVLADPNVPHEDIARAMRRRGSAPGVGSVRAHRNDGHGIE